ncbi:MAG: putative Ubiquitin-activating enzyme E1 1 [Streblomastix strix]|uniref:Putative Ubiquitin-activating enzyme E1 1 n=1 Tax=Streblomastix strix TaxID=222440 RepID=A0A5J4W4Q6_9EUKA|nr:MAG: putative Ubiquitin-activating enzyme E1 1 [Streblomastix strix]
MSNDSERFNQQLINIFSRVSGGSCSTVSALAGGIIGQELIKSVSFKFTQLNQLLYLDHSEVLLISLPNEEDCKHHGCRYDAQIAIFGRQFQERLGKMNYFLVGAGALGCEAIKNYALMGVACDTNGLITLTDMDNIELSNISRQFLFRPWYIQKHKSKTASVASQTINPSFKVNSLMHKIGIETEYIFNDSFWNSLDGVQTALDNVPARIYVDEKYITGCIEWYRRLFEDNFVNRIKQLLHNYPSDATITGDVSFWSRKNKFPKITPFNKDDIQHLQFVGHAAAIRAKNYAINVPVELN